MNDERFLFNVFFCEMLLKEFKDIMNGKIPEHL